MREPLAIGVDIGGTRLRAALVDGSGAILSRATAKTEARGRKRKSARNVSATAVVTTRTSRDSAMAGRVVRREVTVPAGIESAMTRRPSGGDPHDAEDR